MTPSDQKIDYHISGDRLAHILDQVGFKEGRGRVADFHHYLINQENEAFSDLKYTTVRSWFKDHTPPMQKISAIVDSLHEQYQFHHNLSQIKTWWKVGGFYPFVNIDGDRTPTLTQIQDRNAEYEDKLQYIIMALMTEEAGNSFENLSADDLRSIKMKTLNFAKDFSDPFKTECSPEYLRMIIRDNLSRMKKS